MIAAVAVVALAVPATTAGAVPAPHAAPPAPELVQVGTYAYLTAPDYDPLAPISTVLQGPSTIGLGTFAGLDGVPRPVAPSTPTPFAEAVAFRPSTSLPVAPGTTCAAIDGLVASAAGTAAEGVVAVRVRGTFTSVVTRSVPAQATPYPPLADVVATQTTFDLGTRRAVLVGFRTGPAAAGIGAPGLHLHGLTADRAAGGHVLSCVAGSDVQLSIEPVASVRVVMPTAQ